MVARRIAGEPLEYILGWVEFAGVRVVVPPGVFVPRQRSALLVDQARALLSPGTVVVDLCCGAAPIALALASSSPGVQLYAADVDPVAVACARQNLAPYGGRVFVGDLYDALPRELRGGVDVLIANAPYVPTEAIDLMPTEARDQEPRHTLDGGEDGLDLARRIVAGAAQWLAANGTLLIETSSSQAEPLAAAMASASLSALVVEDDERGATCVVGRPLNGDGQTHGGSTGCFAS